MSKLLLQQVNAAYEKLETYFKKVTEEHGGFLDITKLSVEEAENLKLLRYEFWLACDQLTEQAKRYLICSIYS